MRPRALLIFCLSSVLLSTGLYARKKPKAPAVAPVPRMTSDQKALHALNRLTFGARRADIAEIRQQGLENWMEAQLNPAVIPENPVLEAKLAPLDSLRMSTGEMLRHYPTRPMLRTMARPVDSLDTLPITAEQKAMLTDGNPQARRALIETLSPDLRRKIEVLVTPMQIVSRDLTQGKLLRAVYSNRQLEEVLVDFWYNHFNVYLDKGADRSLVTAYERDVIRPHVLGRFKDMLLATARSPAMLFYLDNWQSVSPGIQPNPNQKRRQGLNENYGRELMELHTLGVDGGYTQQDVTEVARCFTGWTIRQPQRGGDFTFNPKMHDNGEKHVLGVTIQAGGGMNDGLKVLDILAHHPSTARFIAKSLATRFVSDSPPEPLVTRMAATFTTTDGDLRAVMRTMLASPEFWDPTTFRSKIKSPLEMVVSAVRAVNGDVEMATGLAGLMNQLGEPLYRKQEPTGYSNRSADWLNSASLLARMNFANSLAQAKVPGVKVDTGDFSGEPKDIELRLLLTDPSPDAVAAIQAGLDQQQQINPDRIGSLVAGLTLGSPDFQRR
jgi:uncharacterized protein (DUF1800 family)